MQENKSQKSMLYLSIIYLIHYLFAIYRESLTTSPSNECTSLELILIFQM